MTDIASIHTPVLLDECCQLVCGGLDQAAADRTPVIVDCTLGLAGHASTFLARASRARLIGIDRDREALDLATDRMKNLGFADRFIPLHAAFDDFSSLMENQGLDTVDAVFMDLGLSSLQIDESDRGFSYSHDAPLDMRMDTDQTVTAQDILRESSKEELTRIFRHYGQERYSRQIASALVRQRDKGHPVETTGQLVQLVDRVVPKSHRSGGNPAKRVFQALRIQVNGELDKLAATLPQIALHLSLGGRLVVESYHSLEDKIVKSFMAQGLQADLPPGLPVIPDDAQPFFTDLTHGAIKADQDEAEHNSRSTSVRLRAVSLSRPLPDTVRKRFHDQIPSNYR